MSVQRKFSTMHEIKIKKDELLKATKANKESHRAAFLKAQEGYREEVIKELDRMLKEAREGKKIQRFINLPEPHDHTQEYETVIRMLEMCVDEEIEISTGEFNQYVMDDWGWKADFTATASNYIK